MNDALAEKRMELISKIVDSLVDTLRALNYPLIVVGDSADDMRIAKPGEIVHERH